MRDPDLPLALGSLVFGIGVAWAARYRLATPQRQLAWDGSAWQVDGPDGGRLSGHVDLMLDLGHWMLVRFSADRANGPAGRRSLWMPLRRRDAASAWPALRVALHAAQPTARAA